MFAGNAADTLILVGNITPDTPARVFEALAANPGTEVIELLSSGGSVYPALAIAWEIHERRLNTRVPEGGMCHSACAYIFLAGAERHALGDLGVHQISAEGGLSGEFAQRTMGHILEALTTFGTDPFIFTAMLRTSPQDMHIVPPDLVNRSAKADAQEAGAPAARVDYASLDGVTRMAKTSTAEEMRSVLFRSSFLLDESYAGPFVDALIKNGVSASVAAMLEAEIVSSDQMDGGVVFGSEVRILWGPLNSGGHVPYRVSIYSPDVRGGIEHQLTVALSDSGSYVNGPEPAAQTSAAQVDLAGKADRWRPPPRP